MMALFRAQKESNDADVAWNVSREGIDDDVPNPQLLVEMQNSQSATESSVSGTDSSGSDSVTSHEDQEVSSSRLMIVPYEAKLWFLGCRLVKFRQVMSSWLDIVLCRPGVGQLAQRCVYELFGRATVLACVDRRPVRAPHLFAERLLLIGHYASNGTHASPSLNRHSQPRARCRARARRRVLATPRVVLQLKPNESGRAEFVDWRWEQFLPLLKPIGLAAMLFGICSSPLGGVEDPEMLERKEGLVSLAKAIGFYDSSINAFELVMEIQARYAEQGGGGDGEGAGGKARGGGGSLAAEWTGVGRGESRVAAREEGEGSNSARNNNEGECFFATEEKKVTGVAQEEGEGSNSARNNNEGECFFVTEEKKMTGGGAVQQEEATAQAGFGRAEGEEASVPTRVEGERGESEGVGAACGESERYINMLIVREVGSDQLQLFSVGNPSLVSRNCTSYWGGSSIKPMSDADRKVISSALASWVGNLNLQCIGISYKPISAELEATIRGLSVGGDGRRREAPSRGAWAAPASQGVLCYCLDLEEEGKDSWVHAMLQNQNWVGMVGFCHMPRPLAPEFIDQLDRNHVRFVYFSEDNEKHSKIFAEKLGLETDWNTCLSLLDVSEEGGSGGPAAAQSERGQPDGGRSARRLPQGVEGIRRYIEVVDNVPLLVRLFVDSTEKSKAGMIKIQRENHEVVISVGFLADRGNVEAFLESDMSIGVYLGKEANAGRVEESGDERLSCAARDREDAWSEQQKARTAGVGGPRAKAKSAGYEDSAASAAFFSQFIRSSCHLVYERANFYSGILELIQLGRQLTPQIQAQLCFMACAYSSLLTNQFLSAVLLVPCSLSSLQVLLLASVVVPMTSWSLMLTFRPVKLVDSIAPKNTKYRPSRVLRYTLYNAARLFPSAVVSFIVFVHTLWSSWAVEEAAGPLGDTKFRYIFGFSLVSGDSFASDRLNHFETESYNQALSFAQNVCMVSCTLYIMTSNATFHHFSSGMFRSNPFRNVAWIAACVLCLVVQAVIFVATQGSSVLSYIKGLDYVTPLIVFGWIPIELLINEWVEKLEHGHHRRVLEIEKLEYNTKLGMQSPV
ncbi:transmembrane protein 94-like [Schistocerca gregaria]|uniref:transmembrane protein 94-like n=1 Tax=Schistocerca gregaria TaxID=7010 RepID=UPI00211EE656|nr:transmembrane protein 94-like [Schistocerca gregaria]